MLISPRHPAAEIPQSSVNPAPIDHPVDQATTLRQRLGTPQPTTLTQPASRKADRADHAAAAQHSPTRLADQAARLRHLLAQLRQTEVPS